MLILLGLCWLHSYILDYEDVEFMPPDSTKEWIGSDEFFFWRLAYTRQDDEEVW